MNLFLQFLLFVLILLIYIHVTHQYKKSEDLELYELDYKDNQHLQEVCDIKQPSIFNFNEINPDLYNIINSDNIEEKESCEVKIKDIQDYYKNDDSVDFVLLSHKSSQSLIKTDTKGIFFSEDNSLFIEDAGIDIVFQNCDYFLKPHFTINTKYDIMFGSEKAYVPFRYHNHYRHFITVNSGKIRVKLTPWKSCKYLYPNHDYENYEFKSPINVWKPDRNHFGEMDKMKFLEFDVTEGQVLYIPCYWWYSYQYYDSNTLLTSFTYNTPMNCIANSKELCFYYLQQHNIKNKPMKTIDLPILEKSTNDTEVIQEINNPDL
tara:strand:+ start:6744 stop:7700 length:957 start_codon:yes stop_codon:yes gene_type:complete